MNRMLGKRIFLYLAILLGTWKNTLAAAENTDKVQNSCLYAIDTNITLSIPMDQYQELYTQACSGVSSAIRDIGIHHNRAGYYADAYMWFYIAFISGSKLAQSNLMSLKSVIDRPGINKARRRAKDWLTTAANEGNIFHQHNLSKLHLDSYYGYLNGNAIEGFTWLIVAEHLSAHMKGCPPCEEYRLELNNDIQKYAPLLTSSEMKKASQKTDSILHALCKKLETRAKCFTP